MWLWLAIINIIAFAVMGVDKRRAAQGKWRIPERTLFFLVLIGGSVGGIFGMYVFRHKTKHTKFVFGFPAILIIQLAMAAFLYYRF